MTDWIDVKMFLNVFSFFFPVEKKKQQQQLVDESPALIASSVASSWTF